MEALRKIEGESLWNQKGSLEVSYEIKGSPQEALRTFNGNHYEFKGNPYGIL